MQLIISQNHILTKTGVEGVDEPEWYDLKGDIVNPGIKYTESERQNPNRKGSDLKKKQPMETNKLGTILNHSNKIGYDGN